MANIAPNLSVAVIVLAGESGDGARGSGWRVLALRSSKPKGQVSS